jgi:hypothetical protein
LFIGAVNLVGRQLFPLVSEYFHKASVVFFYRGFVTINVFAPESKHNTEQDQAFTICQGWNPELQ